MSSAPDAGFRSVLFDGPPPEDGGGEPHTPAHFADLNLDRILAGLRIGRADVPLAGHFCRPLRDPAAVAYRHEVVADLEREATAKTVRGFNARMRDCRELLAHAAAIPHAHRADRVFAEAASAYTGAVEHLRAGLDAAGGDLRSRALRGLRAHLARCTAAAPFRELAAETAELDRRVGELRYQLHIKGTRIRVSRLPEDAPAPADYSAEVEETFATFARGGGENHRVALPGGNEANEVEDGVLDLVARLHPRLFDALADFRARREAAGFQDEVIARADREVQFYLAYTDCTAPFRAAGLPFCLPEVARSADGAGERVRDGYDLALADKLLHEPGGARTPVVTNDYRLDGPERILVVTGPNQGGKTTFARMFGQLHHLAALGLPVPAAAARLVLPDRLHTHFETEEDVRSRRGKLEDELTRIRDTLDGATAESVVIMNESFSSTTLQDARRIGERVLRTVVERGLLCVYVTFVDELAALGPETVSMVGQVDPDDPARRTFRLVRRPADGLAHATAIAEKYRLTEDALRERLRR